MARIFYPQGSLLEVCHPIMHRKYWPPLNQCQDLNLLGPYDHRLRRQPLRLSEAISNGILPPKPFY